MSIAIAYDKSSAADGVPRDEMKANARLIAAAPELLEFAQRVLNGDGDSFRSIAQHAKDVIKKATGSIS
jgi:hypothetical protein